MTQGLKGASKQSLTKHYSAVINPVECRQMLRSIDNYKGSFEVKCTLKLMLMLFVFHAGTSITFSNATGKANRLAYHAA